MSLELHEWDIHIVCRGRDDASGAGGAAANDPPHQALFDSPGAGGKYRSDPLRWRTRRPACRRKPETIDELQRPVGGRSAQAGHRAPARARALPADPAECQRAALRRRALGRPGQGGTRRVRRGAARPRRAGALLRATTGRDAGGAGRPGLRPGPALRSGDARPGTDRAGAATVRRPRRPGAGRVPDRRRTQGRPAPGRAEGPDLGRSARGRLRTAAATQPPVPAGQLVLALPRGVGQPDGQACPPARIAAQPGHLPLSPDVRAGRLHLALRRHGRQAHARHRGGRRRARARPRGGDDRDGRADHADGGRAAGPGAVPRRAGQRGGRGRAAVLSRHDAPGHGDDHGGPRDVRAVSLPRSAAAVMDRHPRRRRR